MSKHKIGWAISIIAILSMVLAACAPAATPTPIVQTQIVEQEGEQTVVVATSEPTTPAPASTETEKKVLRLAWGPGDIPTIDTALAVDAISIQIIDETTVGLTRQNEETAELQNAMASDVKVSEDGLTFTFTIKSGVPWVKYDAKTDKVVEVMACDGTTPRTVTAKDFEYGIKRTLSPKTASDYAYVLTSAIEGAADFNGSDGSDSSKVGVKAIDDQTLEIKFTTPAVYNLNLISLWVSHAQPSWLIDGDDCTTAHSERWVETGAYEGYGPYTLKEWVHDSELTMVKNPFWPGDDVVPTAKIDEINYSLIDSSASLAEFEAGNMDVTTIPAGDMDRILNDPVYQEQIRDTSTIGTEFIGFNTQLEPTNDVRVRKALSLAIDREALVKNVIKSGTPARWFTNPGASGAPKADTNADLGAQYNPEEAKKLMDEYLTEKGITADKLNVVYMFNTSEANKSKAEAIQQMWKDVLGINASLTNQEWKVYLKQRVEGKENAYRGSWVQDYPDANNFMVDVFGPGGGYQDVMDWPVADIKTYKTGQNADYDKFMQLIQDAAKETDAAKRQDMYAQAEQILIVDDAVVAPIQWYSAKEIVSPRVSYTKSISGYDRFEKWDISAAQ
jgi:oligopeptide transport system substrate-binding protein